MRLILVFLFFVSTLLSAVVNQIVLNVNGEIITKQDIFTVVQKMSVDEKKAIDILVFDRLKTAEIKKRNIELSDDELELEIDAVAKRNNTTIEGLKQIIASKNVNFEEWKNGFKEQILQQRLFSDVSKNSFELPSEEELRLEFEKNKKDYPAKTGLEVLKLVANSKVLLEESKNNPMALPNGVQKQSLQLSQDDENEEILEQLSKLEEFDYSDIYTSPSGFYMYKIIEKSAPKGVVFEDVKNQILNKLMSEKEQVLANEFFEKLKLKANIKYFKERI